MAERKIDVLWDDNPVDVTAEANFIWSIANKLRGTYMPDKYGEVIIPMTILRRFECALESTKQKVVDMYKKNPTYPSRVFEKASGFQFYCTSEYSLAELCNDTDNLVANFKDYISGFSENVREIMKNLELESHIGKMDKGGCLLTVVKAFSELDLYPKTYDSIKMGYIFENLIGRFFQNVDAGQYYTGRDIIKLLVSILTAEGCDDIFDDHKVITVLDQACGTGGMLSTAYSYLMHFNSTADVRLFGQEFMPDTHAIGLAEMLIKGQDARNFRHADTFKEDCFTGTKMRFVIENPPFGTPWSGENAKEGQEDAVKKEFSKGFSGGSRWGAGLPSGNDSQLIFIQSAIDKMDENVGRAVIIENGGAPMINGAAASGESQIRKWIIEQDLIEAIIALPTDLFYNTSIQTYVWVLSKNKSKKRVGKIQLIDASTIFHKLRKGLGKKKNEISPDDRKVITELYTNFVNGKLVKILDNEDFLYREYSVYQPLQRNYAITNERIEDMISLGSLSNFYDAGKVYELQNSLTPLKDKEKEKLSELLENKDEYERIINLLKANVDGSKLYKEPVSFRKHLDSILPDVESKLIEKIMDGLSVMDKTATIHRSRKGETIYDKSTKMTEIVPFKVKIDDYMKEEVWPYVPDAKAFFEEDLTKKKPVIKTGAEIPFTKYFYNYTFPESSESLINTFMESQGRANSLVKDLFGAKK